MSTLRTPKKKKTPPLPRKPMVVAQTTKDLMTRLEERKKKK